MKQNLDLLACQMDGELLEIFSLILTFQLKKNGNYLKNGLKEMEQMKLDYRKDS
mgnify:CR=1 FL=1